MATHLGQEMADGLRANLETFCESRRRFGVCSIPVITAVVALKKNDAPENVQTFFQTVRDNVVAFENALDATEMLYQSVLNRTDKSVTDEDLDAMLEVGDRIITAHNDNVIHLKDNMGGVVEYLDNEMDNLLGADANNDLINSIGNTASFGDWFGNSIHMLVSLAKVVIEGDFNQPEQASEDDVASILRAGFGGINGGTPDA